MRNAIILALTLVASLGMGCAEGQLATSKNIPYAPKYGEWTASGPWGGGYVQNVVLCPSDPKRCYSYIDIGGVSRSDDGGNTWRSLNRTLPISCYQVRGLSVDPRNADCFVIAAGSYPHKWEGRAGIYRTVDGGANFTCVAQLDGFGGNDSFRPTGFILDRNPKDPDTIIAATALDGVWTSHDNGLTWACLGLKNIYSSDIRFDILNPSRLWICSPKWSFKHSAPSDYEVGFFRSDDGGATWSKLSSDSPSEILQDPSNPKRLFGIFDDRIIKLSLDGGATWRDFNKGLPYGERYERTDWCWCDYRFNALAAGPDFILTANANGDFFRLDKSQDTWKPVVRKRIDRNGWWAPLDESNWPYFGKALGSIIVDPRDPAHWYFTDWYTVWQTQDAGSVWRPTTEGMAQTVGFTVTPDFFDHDVVYLGMADNGYFRSSDCGSTWNSNKIDSDITCIAPSPSERGVVYACGGHQTSIQASFDSGLT